MKKELRKRLIQTKKKKKFRGKIQKKNLPEIEVIEKKRKEKKPGFQNCKSRNKKKTSFL